jgi:hypothetical protein
MSVKIRSLALFQWVLIDLEYLAAILIAFNYMVRKTNYDFGDSPEGHKLWTKFSDILVKHSDEFSSMYNISIA